MITDPFLQDQVCVVTGSSRGLGREIVFALSDHGAKVVINYRKDQESAHTVAEWMEEKHREYLLAQADVSTPDGAYRLIETAHAHFNRVDVLVNNVGPFSMKPLFDTSIGDWDNGIAANLHSGFYCLKWALPILRRQRQGHVIFIGSPKADSLRARHNAAAYGIAKTGVVLLAKTFAREEGPNGIRANVVSPGIIDLGQYTREEQEYFIQQIAARRLGTPKEVANAVLFLLSPLGSYCNGCVLEVDGGLWL